MKLLGGFFDIDGKLNSIREEEEKSHAPDFWNNPEGFDPKRFADNPLGQENPFAYIPFGADKRKCPGSSFSMLEVMVTIAMIVQRFYLDLPPNAEVKSIVTTLFTMRPSVDKFRLRYK